MYNLNYGNLWDKESASLSRMHAQLRTKTEYVSRRETIGDAGNKEA